MRKKEFTFDQWVHKVFAGRRPTWEWMWEHTHGSEGADWLLTYPTRLFQQPEFLCDMYSDKHLYKGLWNMHIDWELTRSIWEPNFPWPLRPMALS